MAHKSLPQKQVLVPNILLCSHNFYTLEKNNPLALHTRPFNQLSSK